MGKRLEKNYNTYSLWQSKGWWILYAHKAGQDFINEKKTIYCQTKQAFKIKYSQQSYKTTN